MPATDEYWRNLPQMHRVFAGSAILLLGTTILMMYKDESRSWQNFQREAEDLRVERIESELAALESESYLEEIKVLEAERSDVQDSIAALSDAIADFDARLSSLKGQVDVLARDGKGLNAERDKARADYDLGVRDQLDPTRLQELKATFDAAALAAEEKAIEHQRALAAYNALKNGGEGVSGEDGEQAAQDEEIRSLLVQLDDVDTRIAKSKAGEATLTEQKELLAPGNAAVALKRALKELPIINGFNPHLKIQYDWARDLEQGLGMTRVSRVDRCRTCHVNATEFGAGNVPNYSDEDYAQPFASHPNGDLYLTATSPHPVTEFGCTICHDGDGSGTSFQNAEHTPSNPAVAKHWEEEFHWHSNHFWEYPMFPEHFLQSTCIKCHHNVIELGINEKFGASAPKVYEGYTLVRDYGCFGCHEINGYDGPTPIGPDLRLEPGTAEEAAKLAADPNLVAGRMRKVGPSLRHVAQKTTPEFIAYWTEEPQRFRPTTRMPQFFNLTNQHDHTADVLQPIELAGLSKYLDAKSEPMELLSPQEGYVPNIERGKDLFSKRGCLACHNRSGEEFAEINATFGPDLSRIHEKIRPGQAGFQWLYTWIKEPTRHHTRTRMPDLFLDPEGAGEMYVDPAADIAAYLLDGGATEFPGLADAEPYIGVSAVNDESLEAGVRVAEVVQGSPVDRARVQLRDEWLDDPLVVGDVIVSLDGEGVTSAEKLQEIESRLELGQVVELSVIRNGRTRTVQVTVATPLEDLTRLYLSTSMTAARLAKVFEERQFPVPPEAYAEGANLRDFVKGDEIELAPRSVGEEVSEEEWTRRQWVYVGRRTVSRYGCYGCHDIPGFESARPVATGLADWGRKDTSKLAFEHIHEWLHHHGEPDGSSTAERVEHTVTLATQGAEDVEQSALVEASLYESVTHHGRPGFLWQKLRQPRSYDYEKTETKRWDERLKMPKFPFAHEQIEAVSTFVLGLVADPPPPAFQYRPDGPAGDRIEGERLLAKYNCTGCHMLEMPSLEYGADPDDIFSPPLAEGEERAFEMLTHFKPPRDGWTGEHLETGEPILKVSGYPQRLPDPEEDPEYQLYSYVLWDPIKIDDETILRPGQPLAVPAMKIHKMDNGRGGDLANWLIPRLVGKERGVTNINEAWQASPPPLYKEGHKVQTPWLYQFLKYPEQLRYTTVLRMPRFNMDDDEAMAMANYFAVVDDVPYPYQQIPPKQPQVQTLKQLAHQANYPESEHDYLTSSWYVLNGPLCRKCHTVGGNVVTETDPTQVKRGPNLQHVERRLRPEWVQLWVNNPTWVVPYTSMPLNFPYGKQSGMPELFGGDNPRQAESVVDALFNYARLIELHGETTYNPPSAAGEQPATGGAE